MAHALCDPRAWHYTVTIPGLAPGVRTSSAGDVSVSWSPDYRYASHGGRTALVRRLAHAATVVAVGLVAVIMGTLVRGLGVAGAFEVVLFTQG